MKKIHDLPVFTTKKTDKVTSKTVTMNVPEGLVPLVKKTAEGLKYLGLNRTQGEIFNDIYTLYLNSNENLYQIDNYLYTLNELLEISNFKPLFRLDKKEIQEEIEKYLEKNEHTKRREYIIAMVEGLDEASDVKDFSMNVDMVLESAKKETDEYFEEEESNWNEEHSCEDEEDFEEYEYTQEDYNHKFEENIESSRDELFTDRIKSKIEEIIDSFTNNAKDEISKEIFEIPFDYLIRMDEAYSRVVWGIIDSVVLTYDASTIFETLFETYTLASNGVWATVNSDGMARLFFKKYADADLKSKYSVSDFRINNILRNPTSFDSFIDEIRSKISNGIIKYDIYDAIALNLEKNVLGDR